MLNPRPVKSPKKICMLNPMGFFLYAKPQQGNFCHGYSLATILVLVTNKSRKTRKVRVGLWGVATEHFSRSSY